MQKMLLLLVLLAVASCGRESAGTPPPSASDAASAAVSRLLPVLESFPGTYAGVEVLLDQQVVVVHRKPDPGLDAEVRRQGIGVPVEFRDAVYSLTEMKAAVGRLTYEREHWKSRGFTMTAVSPATDGSGVVVRTVEEPGDFAERLRQRYPEMRFDVRKGGEVAFPMDQGPVPVFPSSPVLTKQPGHVSLPPALPTSLVGTK